MAATKLANSGKNMAQTLKQKDTGSLGGSRANVKTFADSFEAGFAVTDVEILYVINIDEHKLDVCTGNGFKRVVELELYYVSVYKVNHTSDSISLYMHNILNIYRRKVVAKAPE